MIEGELCKNAMLNFVLTVSCKKLIDLEKDFSSFLLILAACRLYAFNANSVFVLRLLLVQLQTFWHFGIKFISLPLFGLNLYFVYSL